MDSRIDNNIDSHKFNGPKSSSGRSTQPVHYNQNLQNISNIYNQDLQNEIPHNNTKTDEMILSMPTRTSKSYGFRNPAEHYYDFIDPEFQNSENTVLPFPRGGEHTRGLNKRSVKENFYNRDIY